MTYSPITNGEEDLPDDHGADDAGCNRQHPGWKIVRPGKQTQGRRERLARQSTKSRNHIKIVWSGDEDRLGRRTYRTKRKAGRLGRNHQR